MSPGRDKKSSTKIQVASGLNNKTNIEYYFNLFLVSINYAYFFYKMTQGQYSGGEKGFYFPILETNSLKIEDRKWINKKIV